MEIVAPLNRSISEQYKLVVDVSPVPLILASPDGIIMLTNDELDTLFNYEPEALIGQPVEILVPTEDRDTHPTLREAYMKITAKRRMGSGRDLYGVTSEGIQIPIEIGLDPLKIEDQTWVFVSIIDITERKANEQRLLDALNASASAMVMVNNNGKIELINRTACELFLYSPDELVGEPIERLVPGNNSSAHTVYRNSYFANSETREMGKGQSLFALRSDGSEVAVEIGLTPITSVHGKYVMSTIVDISERLAHEQALEDRNIQLEQLNLELSQFAYSASHDLKSPLSTIAGLLDICLGDLEAGNLNEVRKNIKSAITMSQRNANKVEDVLRLARADFEISKDYEKIDIKILVSSIWNDLTNGVSKAPEIKLEIPEDTNVYTNRQMLYTIVENLLSNAHKFADYHKQEQWIQITSCVENRVFKLDITDNGIGVPKDQKDKIFEMFQKFSTRDGSGLGLSLVKKYVSKLNGEVRYFGDASSTTFSVSLPNAEKAPT